MTGSLRVQAIVLCAHARAFFRAHWSFESDPLLCGFPRALVLRAGFSGLVAIGDDNNRCAGSRGEQLRDYHKFAAAVSLDSRHLGYFLRMNGFSSAYVIGSNALQIFGRMSSSFGVHLIFIGLPGRILWKFFGDTTTPVESHLG